MYAMGIARRQQSTLVAQSTKQLVSLPSLYHGPRITGHRTFHRYCYSAIGLGLATIIDRRLTGKRLFTLSFIRRVKPPCSWPLWGSVRCDSVCTGKPHHRHSVLYGRAIVGSTAAVWLGAVQWFPEPLSGHGHWSLTWASIWRGSRGSSHYCADGGVPASDDVPQSKLLIDSL